MNPARTRLQYSRRFTVPPRLCSTSWRELERPSTPAMTLGLAAASITQSDGARESTSLAARASPWTRRIPSRFSSDRLTSLPGRLKLSKPLTACPLPRPASARAIALPANPQIPEISMRTPVPPSFGLLRRLHGGLLLGLLVGLALLDADLEQVAHEHPGLLLVVKGCGGGRGGCGGRGRDRGGRGH